MFEDKTAENFPGKDIQIQGAQRVQNWIDLKGTNPRHIVI